MSPRGDDTVPCAAVMSGVFALFGLGNPGDQYRNTRHSVGFRFVDALAESNQVKLRLSIRFAAEVGQATIAGQRVWMAKPKTFMNRSGAAVHALCRYYDIDLANAVVVHDDMDLPVGAVRVKRSGGHGGHNGLRDIMERTGGADFMRIRIGIGRPRPGMPSTPYVLGVPPREEQSLIAEALDAALASLPDIVCDRLELAMNVLHSRRPDAPDTTR